MATRNTTKPTVARADLIVPRVWLEGYWRVYGVTQ